MANVADVLTARWDGEARVIHIPEYYRTPPEAPDVLRALGVTKEGMSRDGLHDDPGITLNMMLDDPRSVRWAERVETGQAEIDGVSIANLGRALELGERISLARAHWTVEAIQERIAHPTPPESR